MSDDLLDRATKAYRAETAPDSRDVEVSLARLERRSRAASWSRRRALRVSAFALAAILAGAGAWAGATGRLTAFVDSVVRATTPAKTEPVVHHDAARAKGPTTAATEASATAEVTPPAEPSPKPAVVATHTADAGTGSSHREGRDRLRRPVTVPATEAAPAPAATPDVDALYRAAHDAHFARRDYAAALAAWDAYLAAAGPGSRMLIEARYNRGIALARLGRGAEAVKALEPFAAGEYGDYRRDEARRLIEKLTH